MNILSKIVMEDNIKCRVGMGMDGCQDIHGNYDILIDEHGEISLTYSENYDPTKNIETLDNVLRIIDKNRDGEITGKEEKELTKKSLRRD